ncbi:MAG: hypothetical protein DCC68_11795, partial [Planctomycetota bacterium]
QAASAVIPASQYSLATALETTPPQVSSILVSSLQWTPLFVSFLDSQDLGVGGYELPLGGTSSVLPWSNLDQIKVRFDSDVLLDAEDLTISGVNVADYGIVGFDYDYATLTATWTLAQPIAFDRANIVLAPTVTDLAFNSIAGPRTAGVNVATGDVTGDGAISSADRTANLAHQFQPERSGDLAAAVPQFAAGAVVGGRREGGRSGDGSDSRGLGRASRSSSSRPAEQRCRSGDISGNGPSAGGGG